ncbi:hypothetical protein GOP47_0020538 [Adiantum capillus-veneris]|uniref:Vps72/YL1 C-terminal domain-containing protein n=1 Tax=Adiantum capillus-veneris TaxID=13818 RepID=A0A9D4U9C3_ADICA|nr:hypothetical protein GOP47_0020538 [Adiantum capillus-veneris]
MGNAEHHKERWQRRTPDPSEIMRVLAMADLCNDGAVPSATMQDLEEAGILLPATLPFKRTQLSERYPKGQARGRHWKHLKQMLQAENYHLYPAEEPNYMNIEAPPSMYPAKKYCDITGFEAPYTDPRTKLHFANTDVFKQIRSLPNESVQQYLALRNAQVVLK